MKKLDVYLNQILTGQLSMDVHGDMAFIYDKEYINGNNYALSHSLSLREEAFNAKECRPFFSGILPEANLRTSIARHLGISEKNDFALLSAIGGECAGAVSLLPSPSNLTDLRPEYKILSDNALADILTKMHQRPMIAGEDGVRLSLAGAQDKLPVAIINGQVAIPLGGAPSSHILKPINRDFPSLIENECFCLQLAQRVGLNAVESSLHQVKGNTYLLIKRYDRVATEQGVQRIHQEDFCQALGIVPEMKYQREGGPGLAACFQLIREVSTLPVVDIKMLLQGSLFNLIIGNNDAHGKNFSLLYQGSHIRLAPFYDMISTIFYPELATKMAMKIGSRYDFDGLFPRHIMQMAEEAGLSASLVQKEAIHMIQKIQENIIHSPYSAIILQRADKLKQRFQH
jgi:serine/threonine-protein kinase HipA